MNINRTQGYGTNFKSTIMIDRRIIDCGSDEQKDMLSDEKFLQELDKLRHNGNNDTVTIRDSGGPEYGIFELLITERSEKNVKALMPGWIMRAEDVAELYKEGKEDLKDVKGSPIPDTIADYIIV